jgi:hypothetical protein
MIDKFLLSVKKLPLFFKLSVFIFFTSCGENECEGVKNYVGSETIFSDSSIINGKESKSGQEGILNNSKFRCPSKTMIDTSFPAVVRFFVFYQEGIGACTGTFINDHTILTAAHCFKGHKTIDENGLVTGANVIVVDGPRVLKSQVFANTKYFKGNDHKYDQAVIFVPKGTAKSTLELSFEDPILRSTVISVGYGKNSVIESENDDKKRWGTNKIEGVEDDYVQIKGDCVNRADGRNVAPDKGDSGGPLLYEGKIIGTLSYKEAFSINDECSERANINYVKVSNKKSQSFLNSASAWCDKNCSL